MHVQSRATTRGKCKDVHGAHCGHGQESVRLEWDDREAEESEKSEEEVLVQDYLSKTDGLRHNAYEEVAKFGGVYLVTDKGGLVNVLDYLNSEDTLKTEKWAGDHIYELGLFTKFMGLAHQVSLKETLFQTCAPIQERFVGILNSPSNLIGVDAEVNGLKAIYLQKTRPRSLLKHPAIYAALEAYMKKVERRYNEVVNRLGDALASLVADDGGGLGSRGEQKGQKIKEAFLEYSSEAFRNAMTKIKEDNQKLERRRGAAKESQNGTLAIRNPKIKI